MSQCCGQLQVYHVLFFVLQGRQEDAEEYLGFTLNGLHEEMLALKKLVCPPDESVFTFLFHSHFVTLQFLLSKIYVYLSDIDLRPGTCQEKEKVHF